ncbi:MAG: MAPEG family protein [Prochlorotrichaceae cyanobacterium]
MSPTVVYPGLVTIAALIMYYAVTLNVGRARFKYGVKPPAMTGDPGFECAVRIQQNTLEQMVFFLPLLWLFAYSLNVMWATILGSVWVVGRILYAIGYAQAPEKRAPGFALSSLSALALLVGTIVGLVRSFWV